MKYAVILAQILLEDRCGLAGLVLRRGRQLIRAVVLQLASASVGRATCAQCLRGMPLRPAMCLIVPPGPTSGPQDALKATASKWERGMAARLGVGPAERLNMVCIAKEND